MNGYRLLTSPMANPKLAKNLAMGYLTAGLTLAPAEESGHNVCPAHSPGCAAACLYWAGRGRMRQTQTARIQRTRLWLDEPRVFEAILHADLAWLTLEARRRDVKAACRLNMTSDIPWEQFGVPQEHPTIRFYDYTKVRHRYDPHNYHLTFSRSELNDRVCLKILEQGGNVSVVFRKRLPATWQGYRVIDGDLHDCRFLDPDGVVVGLRAKGERAKNDQSGFVVDP